MESDLELTYEYLPERGNPAAVFDTMSKYIKGYDDLGILLADAVGVKDEFSLRLVKVKEGSICSMLGAAKEKLDSIFAKAIYDSAVQLHNELTEVDETATEDDVIKLAKKLEESLHQSLGADTVMSPVVNPQRLAQVLQTLSSANDNLIAGESVKVSSYGKKANVNTAWRFTGEPKDMFKGFIQSFSGELKLKVKIPVNQGSQAWSVTSLANNTTFSAKVVNGEWLEKYQEVKISPISGKDIVTAMVEYDVFEGSHGSEIKNAKILDVLHIQRFKGKQSDFFDD